MCGRPPFWSFSRAGGTGTNAYPIHPKITAHTTHTYFSSISGAWSALARLESKQIKHQRQSIDDTRDTHTILLV